MRYLVVVEGRSVLEIRTLATLLVEALNLYVCGRHDVKTHRRRNKIETGRCKCREERTPEKGCSLLLEAMIDIGRRNNSVGSMLRM